MPTVNTSCEHCLFKKVISTKIGLVQTGCLLGRIDKFRKLGVEVNLEKNRSTNGKHFLIHGRFCTTLRQERWANKQEQPSQAVRKEIQIKCDIIILMCDSSTIDSLTKTINSAVAQSVPPTTIRVVVRSNPVDVYNYLNSVVPDNIGIAVHDVKLDLNREEMIDVAANKSESTYYAVFNGDCIIPQDFLSKIDKAINDDLLQICLVKPDENGNGLVVAKELHKMIGGNQEVALHENNDKISNIVDKIMYVANKENSMGVVAVMESL